MATDRPTPAERADAADRFIEKIAEARQAIWEAQRILREQRPPGASTHVYPLFTWGERLHAFCERAWEPLWDAHREAAIQGYDERRAAEKEAAGAASQESVAADA